VNGHTAAVLMGNRDDLLVLSMNDFSLKPIVLDDLIAAISQPYNGKSDPNNHSIIP
jgi:hypothetical protein